MAILSFFWVVWHVRNKARFEGEKPVVRHCLRMLWKSIKEVEFFRFGSTKQVDDFKILKQLGFIILPSRPERIVQVNWCTPPLGFTKVNTDGLALGAPGEAGLIWWYIPQL